MNFDFNKDSYYASAYYNYFNDTITLNLGKILRCKSISDNDKIQLMTWQIEHEVIHAVIMKIENHEASHKFEYVAWAILDKKSFLKIVSVAKKVGYFYSYKCKYLEKR